MMASTYPLEVVQADRWIKENKNLKGDELKSAVAKQAWDESVKSLVAAPDVLAMMSSKLDWTLKLGDAVLAQQPDVMDAIQRLRTKAEANNKLTSTKEQTVTKSQEQGKEVIVIEQTDPNTIYVPVLRSCRRVRRMALSGISAILFPAAGLHRRRPHRDRDCLWRRLGAWALGVRRKLLGRRINWSKSTTSTSTAQGESARRQQLATQSGTPPGRPLQQADVHKGSVTTTFAAGDKSDGFPRPWRQPGAAPWRRARWRTAWCVAGGGRPGAGQLPGGQAWCWCGKPAFARPSAGQRPAGRRLAGQRPSGGARRVNATGGGNAFGNVGSGRVANVQSGARPREPRRRRWRCQRRRRRRRRWWRRRCAAAAVAAVGRRRRWRRRRPAVRYRAQARHRSARPARQWTWLLPLQLQRQRARLCRRDRAGGASRSCRRPSCATGMAICGSTTKSWASNSRLTRNGSRRAPGSRCPGLPLTFAQQELGSRMS